LLKFLALALICVLTALASFAQTEGARISGRVTDLRGAVIVGAQCTITNIETDVSTVTATNEDGIYVIPDLHPATYRLTIEKEGFRTVVQPTLQLYVQDAVNENFTLAIGPASESVTVFSDTFGVRTDSAAVSTVVDDQFVQNTPLNGRSFQSLLALAPGVVFTSQNEGVGQFSVNGQRSDANYFMVDGVSANFGITPTCCLSQTLGGAIPGLTSGGGTNGLVSVDAMQSSESKPLRMRRNSGAPQGGRSRLSRNLAPINFTARHSTIFVTTFSTPEIILTGHRFPGPRFARMTLAGRLAVPSAKTKLFSSFVTKVCG
jgi:Carboxypeptidase regulatory-like domain/TonB-dependent Receptor Plug Domain